MQALYSTDPVTIRGTSWRYAIRADDGRGEYQWQRHQSEAWLPLAVYPHRVLGLITLAQLDRAIYEPQRDRIAAARAACGSMSRAFSLAPQAQTGLQAPLFKIIADDAKA